MRRRRTLVKLGVLVLIVAAFVVARPYLFPAKPVEVEVEPVAKGVVRETVSSPSAGTVHAHREAVVAAEASGRIATVHRDQEDRVAALAPVVSLDDAEAKVELHAAQAALATRQSARDQADVALAKAKQDLARAESLVSQKLVALESWQAADTAKKLAEGALDVAGLQVAEAKVAIDRSTVQIGKRHILAPFAGVIRWRHVEVGEHVTVGKPCFEIYDDSRLFVRAPIDEVDLPKIEIGDDTDVSLEQFPDRVFRGKVRKIAPAVRMSQELNRVGELEVDLAELPGAGNGNGNGKVENENANEETGTGTGTERNGSYPPGEGPIRPGSSADIEVVVDIRSDVIRVPSYAVHEERDRKAFFVYVVEGDRAVKRPVEVGVWNWDYTEVRSGLREGDPLIVSIDVEGLEDGALVRAKPSSRP